MLSDLFKSALVAPPKLLASRGGQGYEAASTGRRAFNWQPNRLGPTGNLWTSMDLMRARARDEIRNNPLAASAIDNFEAQVIGNGIRPKWNIPNVALKSKIEVEFEKWAKSTLCDKNGVSSFYGLQALACREIFEAGEVFAHLVTAPSAFKLRVPLQVELIEGEQCPTWLTFGSIGAGIDMPKGNVVRIGIEFDKYNRRAAYQMYTVNPGDTMFFPMDGLTFMRLLAQNCLHVYKPKRAGQLRGEPALVVVLTLLHELSKVDDAMVMRKEVQAMFAGFITSQTPDVLPLPTSDTDIGSYSSPPAPPFTPPGVAISKIESGSFQALGPGEQITFPTLPQDNDYTSFMEYQLHRLATGVGLTHEILTGNLKGVNLSSIRAGLLDFRRRVEQFQRNTVITQFCQPIAARWLNEAVQSGALKLPGYNNDPSVYEDITWSTPAWPWVDPEKDMQERLGKVRAGFTSRTAICAEGAEDIAVVDATQAQERERAVSLGLVYDSNPNQILIGRETNPTAVPPDDADPAAVKLGTKVAAEEEQAAEE